MDATESVVAGNAQASAGATYSIGADKGFLIVAYANEGGNGDFSFKYWLEAELKPESDETVAVPVAADDSVVVGEPEEAQLTTEEVSAYVDAETPVEQNTEDQGNVPPLAHEDLLFYALCAGAGVLLVTIAVICYKCKGSGRGKV